MLRVCHITSNHPRTDQRIFWKECMSLSNNGNNVHLIVSDGKGSQIVGSINIHDAGGKYNLVKRLIKTHRKIKRIAINLNCDVYHFHDPELVFVGLWLSRRGRKVIWDMHENIPADIMQKKRFPLFGRKIMVWLYSFLEIFAVKHFNGIVCTRKSVLNSLQKYNKNVVLIENMPLTNYLVNPLSREERIISFAGAIVSNYQHKEIIQAIDNIDNVKYIMAGPVYNQNYLDELKSLKGYSKVEYVGRVSFEDVKKIYSQANIGLAIHKYTPNMDGKMGNYALTKIFEMMYWKLPVICTNYDLWEEEIFSVAKCGITVDPSSVTQIKNAIQYLLDNPIIAKKMGNNGHDLVIDKFNWKDQEKKLLNLYKNL